MPRSSDICYLRGRARTRPRLEAGFAWPSSRAHSHRLANGSVLADTENTVDGLTVFIRSRFNSVAGLSQVGDGGPSGMRFPFQRLDNYINGRTALITEQFNELSTLVLSGCVVCL